MPLSPNLDHLSSLHLRDVPAVRPTLADLACRACALDELIEDYAQQDAEPPADLVRDHTEAQRAYREAWDAYCASVAADVQRDAA